MGDDRGVFVHPNALCEAKDVGEGTRVWAFAHVMDGARVGADCNIADHAFVESGAILGDRVTVKNGVLIWVGVTIGDDCFIGPGAKFTNDRFPRSGRANIPEIKARQENGSWLVKTSVGRGASIGAGAVIGPGVAIGPWAMVGAGAVVTLDVEPHALVVGNPARAVGWVCRSGYRLEEADGGYRCPHCGRSLAAPGDGGC